MTVILSVITELIRVFLYAQTVLFVILPAMPFFGGKANPITYLCEILCDFWKRPAELMLGRITCRHPGFTDKASLIAMSVLFAVAKTLPEIL